MREVICESYREELQRNALAVIEPGDQDFLRLDHPNVAIVFVFGREPTMVTVAAFVQGRST